MQILFLAFGTRGDVQPLAVLATSLASSQPSWTIAFVTHESHRSSLGPALASASVSFHGISSAPVLARSGVSGPLSSEGQPPKRERLKEVDLQDHEDRPAKVQPCAQEDLTLAGSAEDLSCHEDSDDEVWRSMEMKQREECLAVAQSFVGESESGLLVFNLFALEGWHIAEYLRVPSVAAAPYVVPYSAPSAFERRFRNAHPALFRRLVSAKPGQVGWREVEHWMWPLFTERWASWREFSLRLSPCPLLDPVTGTPIQHGWPSPTPLLYGFSPQVVEVPGYWPESVHVTGFWTPGKRWEAATVPCRDDSYKPPETLAHFLEDGDPPIYITFSSMGSMGLLHDPEALLHTVVHAVEASGHRAILSTGGYAPLESAARSLSGGMNLDVCNVDGRDVDVLPMLAKGRVLLLSTSVPHSWLLPQCVLTFHHGGSGTTAAALSAGIPQLICAFLFDQFYWAERMAWIGVAPEPLRPSVLMPSGSQSRSDGSAMVASAIRAACAKDIQSRASQLARQLHTEDGVGAACAVLVRCATG